MQYVRSHLDSKKHKMQEPHAPYNRFTPNLKHPQTMSKPAKLERGTRSIPRSQKHFTHQIDQIPTTWSRYSRPDRSVTYYLNDLHSIFRVGYVVCMTRFVNRKPKVVSFGFSRPKTDILIYRFIGEKTTKTGFISVGASRFFGFGLPKKPDRNRPTFRWNFRWKTEEPIHPFFVLGSQHCCVWHGSWTGVCRVVSVWYGSCKTYHNGKQTIY